MKLYSSLVVFNIVQSKSRAQNQCPVPIHSPLKSKSTTQNLPSGILVFCKTYFIPMLIHIHQVLLGFMTFKKGPTLNPFYEGHSLSEPLWVFLEGQSERSGLVLCVLLLGAIWYHWVLSEGIKSCSVLIWETQFCHNRVHFRWMMTKKIKTDTRNLL